MRGKICLTPGSIYSVGADHDRNVVLTVTLPRGVDRGRVREYIFGHHGVTTAGETAAAKLKRYEEMYAARDLINKAFHEALEPVIGDLYRTIWPLTIAGRTIDGEVMPMTYDEYLTSNSEGETHEKRADDAVETGQDQGQEVEAQRGDGEG